MSAGAVGEARPGREFPERMRWTGQGVTADEIDAELDRLHRAAGGGDRVLALARTLNLIVVPCSDRRNPGVERALEALGDHTPSRTLVLREHGANRVDATVVMECQTAAGAGHVGLCHDRVLMTMDAARLGHSASLIAPLLVRDLPTVLWLPEARSHPPDPRLLERAQSLLVDSTSGGDGDLARFAELAAPRYVEAAEEMQKQMLNGEDGFPTDPLDFHKRLYNATSRPFAKLADDVLRDEDYLEISKRSLGYYSVLDGIFRRASEQFFGNLRLPTVSDTTQIAGLVVGLDDRVDRLEEMLEDFEERLDRVEEKLEGLDRIEDKLDRLLAATSEESA